MNIEVNKKMVNELVQWDKIKGEIDEAKDIREIKKISDKLEAIRAIARQTNQSLEVQNRIAEYRLDIVRKMGEWLQQNVKHEGASIKGWKNESMDSTRLADVGISRDLSSKAQRIAKLDEKQFEEYKTETKATEKEITLAGAVKLAKQIIREEKIDEQKENIKQENVKQPEGDYDVIVIDPPWKYGTKYDPEGRRVSSPYPEMAQDELTKIKLPAKDDCVLWLWTTNDFILDAYELLEEWGFAPKALLTWDKVNIGIGYWLRNVTEHCILAVKGSPVWTNKKYSTLISEKRNAHSAKPEGFYAMVDDICVGRKLDYFARKKRDGWSVYGDEINVKEKEE